MNREETLKRHISNFSVDCEVFLHKESKQSWKNNLLPTWVNKENAGLRIFTPLLRT